MDFGGMTWHAGLVLAAVVIGPVGCLVSLGYAIRVDHREAWRMPMLVTALLGFVSILGACLTGDRTLSTNPGLAVDPQVVGAHQDYAVRLVLPTVGWFVMATLTGWVNPRTGALRTMLPMLLSGFALVVLVLVALAGDADARSIWHAVAEKF